VYYQEISVKGFVRKAITTTRIVALAIMFVTAVKTNIKMRYGFVRLFDGSPTMPDEPPLNNARTRML
jgi:hypothetical protein